MADSFDWDEDNTLAHKLGDNNVFFKIEKNTLPQGGVFLLFYSDKEALQKEHLPHHEGVYLINGSELAKQIVNDTLTHFGLEEKTKNIDPRVMHEFLHNEVHKDLLSPKDREEGKTFSQLEAERERQTEWDANHDHEKTAKDDEFTENLPKDVWYYDEKDKSDILSHSLINQTVYYQMKNRENVIGLSVMSEDGWRLLRGSDVTPDFVLPYSENNKTTAKKIVEETINYFDENQSKNRYEPLDTFRKHLESAKNLTLISNVLANEKSQTVKNRELGEIYVDKGLTGKNGYGLQHIIEGRHNKDKFGEDEISALLCKVVDSVQNGKVTVEQPKITNGRDAGRIGIEKDGIIGFVSKVRGDKDEKFVITGFSINKKKKEATEAIQAVIATYGSTSAFSGIRKQVGAVVSSLQQVSPQLGEKSSPAENNKTQNRQLEAAKKTGYVQGVCECVAAIGDDHALGKKLLTEMKVTKDMAKHYAKPETYKELEKGIFAPKQEQNLERTRGVKR
jgi:hypothetical protein